MHVFGIIREPRSGCERARLKLLVLFVSVTDSGQKVATLGGPILNEIVTESSVSCEEYSAANRPYL